MEFVRIPRVYLVLLAFLLVAGCRSGDRQVRLTVLAAASLKNAFADVEKRYEGLHPNVDVTLNFGGSQQLAWQLVQGGPGDVLATADHVQMAVAAGRVRKSTVRDFATNRLVVVFPENNPCDIRSLEDLDHPSCRLVLADVSVPAGRYTHEALEKVSTTDPGFSARTMSRVISYEQDVRAVLSRVVMGEADAGIVYESDVHGKAGLRYFAIPSDVKQTIRYPIAIVEDTRQPGHAHAFVTLLLSAEGRSLLRKHGFGVP